MSADGFTRLFNPFMADLPMFFLIALAVCVLVWLEREEEFFHTPASGNEGG